MHFKEYAYKQIVLPRMEQSPSNEFTEPDSFAI